MTKSHQPPVGVGNGELSEACDSSGAPRATTARTVQQGRRIGLLKAAVGSADRGGGAGGGGASQEQKASHKTLSLAFQKNATTKPRTWSIRSQAHRHQMAERRWTGMRYAHERRIVQLPAAEPGHVQSGPGDGAAAHAQPSHKQWTLESADDWTQAVLA
jgi:hypothetical protein